MMKQKKKNQLVFLVRNRFLPFEYFDYESFRCSDVKLLTSQCLMPNIQAYEAKSYEQHQGCNQSCYSTEKSTSTHPVMMFIIHMVAQTMAVESLFLLGTP